MTADDITRYLIAHDLFPKPPYENMLPRREQKKLKHGDWVILALTPMEASPPVQLIWPGLGRAMINHWETRKTQAISLDSIVCRLDVSPVARAVNHEPGDV